MDTLYNNFQPHENSFRELANYSEAPPDPMNCKYLCFVGHAIGYFTIVRRNVGCN